MSSFSTETKLYPPTYEEVDAAIAKARAMRAGAMRDAVRALWAMIRPKATTDAAAHPGNRKTAEA